MVGLIHNNNETAYLEEVRCLTQWCQKNNLHLNASKTKDMLVDFGRMQVRDYTPLSINGTPVERVDTFKYLDVQITDDLTWSTHLGTMVKKASQRLFHLRRLKKFRASKPVLQSFYTCTIKSMLTGNITAWYRNTTMQDCKALQRVVRSAERTIGGQLHNLGDIYIKRCKGRTTSMLKDPSHPGYGLFSAPLREQIPLTCSRLRDSGRVSTPKLSGILMALMPKRRLHLYTYLSNPLYSYVQ